MKHGKVLEERVDQAKPLVIARGFASMAGGDGQPAKAAAALEEMRLREAQYLDSLPGSERARVTVAIAQVEAFMEDIKTPEQMLEAFGVPGMGDEE